MPDTRYIEDASGNTVVYSYTAGQTKAVCVYAEYGDFTDGGAAAGTLTFSDALPANAFVLCSKVEVNTAFSGGASTSAIALTVGDGSDADRFGAGINLLTTADKVDGVVGEAAVAADTDVVLTVTETGHTDFGVVDAGACTVTITYLEL